MRKFFIALSAVLLALALVIPGAGPADAKSAKKRGKPSIMKGCKACHEAEKNTLRGKFVSYSEKFNSVSVNVGPLVWVVKYDGKTMKDANQLRHSVAATTPDSDVPIVAFREGRGSGAQTN